MGEIIVYGEIRNSVVSLQFSVACVFLCKCYLAQYLLASRKRTTLNIYLASEFHQNLQNIYTTLAKLGQKIQCGDML